MRNPLIAKKEKAIPMSEGNKNSYQTEDFGVFKNISTREGSVEKVPYLDKDVVNKEYCDKIKGIQVRFEDEFFQGGTVTEAVGAETFAKWIHAGTNLIAPQRVSNYGLVLLQVGDVLNDETIMTTSQEYAKLYVGPSPTGPRNNVSLTIVCYPYQEDVNADILFGLGTIDWTPFNHFIGFKVSLATSNYYIAKNGTTESATSVLVSSTTYPVFRIELNTDDNAVYYYINDVFVKKLAPIWGAMYASPYFSIKNVGGVHSTAAFYVDYVRLIADRYYVDNHIG